MIENSFVQRIFVDPSRDAIQKSVEYKRLQMADVNYPVTSAERVVEGAISNPNRDARFELYRKKGIHGENLITFPLRTALSILGNERCSDSRGQIFSILYSNKSVENKINALELLVARQVERAMYDPAHYFGTPIDKLKGEKLKHYRMRLGVPQKINGKWYKLPTTSEMKEKYSAWLYRNRPARQPAITWIKEGGFSQFLIAGGADDDVLFQDQLKALDPDGLRALRNHHTNQGLSLEDLAKIIKHRSIREENELLGSVVLMPREAVQMTQAKNKREDRNKKT